MGIEPTYAAWKAAVLPLNYTRIGTRSIEPTAMKAMIPAGRSLSTQVESGSDRRGGETKFFLVQRRSGCDWGGARAEPTFGLGARGERGAQVVAQAFLLAGSRDFPVPCSRAAFTETGNWRLESRLYLPTRMSALRAGRERGETHRRPGRSRGNGGVDGVWWTDRVQSLERGVRNERRRLGRARRPAVGFPRALPKQPASGPRLLTSSPTNGTVPTTSL